MPAIEPSLAILQKIERALALDRGLAMSNSDLHELANYINQNAASAKAHQDMLHALVERSPAHASYCIH